MSLKYSQVLRKNTRTNIKSVYANIVTNYVPQKNIAEEIAAATTITYPDVLAVIKALEEKIRNEIIKGNGVQLDILGSFYPTLESKGAEDTAHFTHNLIKNVRIRFRPSTQLLQDVRSQARYEKALTKSAIAEAIRKRDEDMDAEAQESREEAANGNDGE